MKTETEEHKHTNWHRMPNGWTPATYQTLPPPDACYN